MIKLHQFRPAWGLTTASPFCQKLETYLRMAGIEHQVVVERDTRRAPKGKLPYIEEADGRLLGDSGFIITHLEACSGRPLDAALTPEQRAQALALRRLLEDSLYWVVVHSRWIDPVGWKVAGPAFFGRLPAPLRLAVPPLVRRAVAASLNAQGLGRHAEDEIYEIGRDNLDALACLLGDGPYFFGAAPTSADAAAYGMVAHILRPPIESPLKIHLRKLGNLRDFCDRVRDTYYPDTAGGR